jgi:hypothetical protein
MFKRQKPPLEWPRGSTDFLDPWPSLSDRALRTVVRQEPRRRAVTAPEGIGPTAFDDLMATALVWLLGTVGFVTGWALFVG